MMWTMEHCKDEDTRARTRYAARGWRATAVLVGLGALGAPACQIEPPGEPAPAPRARGGSLIDPAVPPVAEVVAPLSGEYCEIQVDGQGLLDMETDYLAHVITCENGGANLEALKAQAIAARSVAYYAIETDGSICDSQACQVYSCGATPNALSYQAVEETSGLYMLFNSTLTYGFYVAGDNGVTPPDCVGNPAVGTEQWVTYNEGLSGTDVEQTNLGFVFDPGDFGYGQNRGCMSQWGARCLENNNGYDYLDILRFYYGEDIQLEQSEGECILDLPGEGSSSGDPGTTDTGDGLDTGTTDTGASLDTGTTDEEGSEGPGSEEGSASASDGPLPGGTEGPPGTTGDGDTEPALPGTFGSDDDGGGCACRSDAAPRGSLGWLLGLVGLGVLRRRRGA